MWKSQGGDRRRGGQWGGSTGRNAEQLGELGLTRQGDAAAGDQNGGPRDPQGPVSKSKQDVKVSAGVQPLWETAGGSEVASSEAGSAGSVNELVVGPGVGEGEAFWAGTLGNGGKPPCPPERRAVPGRQPP